jgi:hypothetical protein
MMVSPTDITVFANGLSYSPLGIRNLGSGTYSGVGIVTQVCQS